MKEAEVKVKRYKRENCGAIYSNSTKYKISTCPITGKEICSKCSVVVTLYEPCNDYYENVRVHPSAVSDDYNIYETEYRKATENIKREFYKKIEELNKGYLKGDVRKYLYFLLT